MKSRRCVGSLKLLEVVGYLLLIAALEAQYVGNISFMLQQQVKQEQQIVKLMLGLGGLHLNYPLVFG